MRTRREQSERCSFYVYSAPLMVLYRNARALVTRYCDPPDTYVRDSSATVYYTGMYNCTIVHIHPIMAHTLRTTYSISDSVLLAAICYRL